jgi:outer membrane receptor for ferrienterochelin and colicin
VAITNQAYVVEGRYRNTVPDGRTREEGVDRDVTWRGSIQFTLEEAAASASGSTLVEVGGQTQWLRTSRVRRRFTAATSVMLLDRAGAPTTQAAWVNVRWTPRPSFTLTPGARVEHFSFVDTVSASPWLLAEWRATPGTSVRASAGAAHQGPAFDQSLHPPAAVSEGGPPGPEESITADLGIEHRLPDAWRVSVTGYYRRDRHGFRSEINDFKLVGNRLVGPTAAVWADTVTGDASGLEITLDRRGARGVSGWIAYALGRARHRDRRTGESYDADYDQRHMVNAYASYRASASLGLSARFRYGSNFPVAGYFVRAGDEFYVTTSKNRERQPAYARLDLRAERAFTYRRRRLTLFLETLNTLNRRNVALGDFGINFGNLVVSDLLEDGLPFLPSAGVLIEF